MNALISCDMRRHLRTFIKTPKIRIKTLLALILNTPPLKKSCGGDPSPFQHEFMLYFFVRAKHFNSDEDHLLYYKNS